MLLTINAIQGGYKARPILHDVQFSLAPGQVVGLIGPNGSGKTTLIRAVSGVLPDIDGDFHLGKLDLQRIPSRQRARHLAVVPQSAMLPPVFTVWELVSLGRTPHLNWLGQMGDHDHERIEWALEATQLSQFRDHPVGQLSGGEQQRVLLARALAQEAPVLLLDEPTAHLDIQHQATFLDLVRRMAIEQQLSVLIAIHDLNLAARYADELVLLAEGRVLATGSPKKVLTAENLQAAYQAPIQVQEHPKDGQPWLMVVPGAR
ncbi:MAG: ABC transporter ATP-binding protein [Chloroflexi bacterium]|nr:ABC transporter ATP-binding protein [Chloroflexota bacterium]